jgi:hypothetical protein
MDHVNSINCFLCSVLICVPPFVISHFQNTIVHQNSQQLRLGVAEVEPCVRPFVLNHDDVVKFGGHFLILKLAQVDLGT